MCYRYEGSFDPFTTNQTNNQTQGGPVLVQAVAGGKSTLMVRTHIFKTRVVYDCVWTAPMDLTRVNEWPFPNHDERRHH